MSTDYKRQAREYDLITVGGSRIADSVCEGIRVEEGDGTRYSRGGVAIEQIEW